MQKGVKPKLVTDGNLFCILGSRLKRFAQNIQEPGIGFHQVFEVLNKSSQTYLKFPSGPLPLRWGRASVGVNRSFIPLPLFPSREGRGYFLIGEENSQTERCKNQVFSGKLARCSRANKNPIVLLKRISTLPWLRLLFLRQFWLLSPVAKNTFHSLSHSEKP